MLLCIDVGLEPGTEESVLYGVTDVLSFIGHANFSFGWRCWSKPDWRKPPFSSGYALVTTVLDFS